MKASGFLNSLFSLLLRALDHATLRVGKHTSPSAGNYENVASRLGIGLWSDPGNRRAETAARHMAVCSVRLVGGIGKVHTFRTATIRGAAHTKTNCERGGMGGLGVARLCHALHGRLGRL